MKRLTCKILPGCTQEMALNQVEQRTAAVSKVINRSSLVVGMRKLGGAFSQYHFSPKPNFHAQGINFLISACLFPCCSGGTQVSNHHQALERSFFRYWTPTMTGKHKAEKDEGPRILLAGRPDLERCDNKISTSKYSLLSFIPVVSQIRLMLRFCTTRHVGQQQKALNEIFHQRIR